MRREVRSLNRLGIDRFRAYLRKVRDGAVLPAPVELLEDLGYSTELPAEIPLDPPVIGDRLALGRYLVDLLEPLDAQITDRDVGLWAWLSAALLDQVSPPDASGGRRPGQDYRHIPDFTYRHRHRHLLFGPYHVYRRHGERSALLLSGPLHAESGIYHEIVSRQDLIANRGVIDAAVALYFDRRRGRPKQGAMSHGHPGTVRRFVRVLQQLDLTYDIYGLSARQLLELLPEEFDIWQPQHGLDIDGAELRPTPVRPARAVAKERDGPV